MILRRYLLRETATAFAFFLVLIVLIYLTSTGVDYLGEAASGQLAEDLIAWIVLLKLLTALKIIVPLCLYLALLLVVGRMRRQHELTTYAMLGLGTGFLFRSVTVLSGTCALVVAMVALVFEPWADRKVYTLEMRAKEQAEVFGLSAGQFRELSGGTKVIFAEEVSADNRDLRDVFLRVRVGEEEGVLAADGAFIEDDERLGGRFVVFESGRRYDGRPGQADYSIVEFDKYGVLLESAPRAEDPRLRQNVSMAPTHELLGRDDFHAAAEVHWRLAMPIATLLLSLLAVVLARLRALGGPYATMLAGILIYFLYSNLLGIAKAYAKKGVLAPEYALLPVHGALLLLVVLLAWSVSGFRRPGGR